MVEFDAIIVGAGPAGCACAYTLAKQQLKVLLIERGKFAGSKNMWGGALYGPVLGDLSPEFLKEAPIERYVKRRILSLLSEESYFSLESAVNNESPDVPQDGAIILRAKFDRWFAEKARKAGAILANGVQVEDLLWKDGSIVGVKVGKDEIHGSVVVACDGVNSILAQKAGLKAELNPVGVKQGVKEVIKLPLETIEQRFNIQGNEGIAWEFLGKCTRGLPGGGFIYTNKDSLSVGVVVQLNALLENKVKANDLLEDFKRQPVVARLIDGGTLVEYSSHLIPTYGVSSTSRLFSDRFLITGDAAGLVLGTGLILEGANFAIASGIAAAKAIVRAKETGDFSAKALSHYQRLLEDNFVLKDFKTFKKMTHVLENPRLYSTYPDLVCSLWHKIHTNDGNPRKSVRQLLKEELKGRVSWWQLARDLIHMGGSL
ncbi:MAG: FAD-dependent oxidoreductase [Desulfobulbaceae bacterium]|nr:FAD-dependent oxidoreductase [Desulfobulbaceae bacterium]